MQGTRESKPNNVSMMKMELSKAFQATFKSELKPYIKMKYAFVTSDESQVYAFMKATAKKIKTLTVSDLEKMVKSHLSKSVEMLDAISSSSDIERQRGYLVILNGNMVALAMNIKLPSETLYVQKWSFWNWKKAEGLQEKIGEVILTNIAFINRQEASFHPPKNYIKKG